MRVVGDFQEQTRNVRTGADGTYLLAFKKKGTYRISPSLAKAGFEPKSYRVPITNVDVTGKDFVIQPAKVVTLTIRKRKFSLDSNYVQNGGKLKICNMDPFPHNPFSNSVGNEFSLFGTKKVPIGGCRAVFLTNTTNGGIDLVQVFDQNSPNATIGVYVAP